MTYSLGDTWSMSLIIFFFSCYWGHIDYSQPDRRPTVNDGAETMSQTNTIHHFKNEQPDMWPWSGSIDSWILNSYQASDFFSFRLESSNSSQPFPSFSFPRRFFFFWLHLLLYSPFLKIIIIIIFFTFLKNMFFPPLLPFGYIREAHSWCSSNGSRIVLATWCQQLWGPGTSHQDLFQFGS